MNPLTPSPTIPQIAVLTGRYFAYVYIGHCRVEGDTLVITQASNLRRFGTTAGLGQLANSGKAPQSRIDPVGTVRAPLSAVIHLIDCNPAAWPELAVSETKAPAEAA